MKRRWEAFPDRAKRPITHVYATHIILGAAGATREMGEKSAYAPGDSKLRRTAFLSANSDRLQGEADKTCQASYHEDPEIRT